MKELLAGGLGVVPIVIIAVAAVLVLASVIYGIFRKFVRMAWTSWQLLVIFAFTLLLPFIPLPDGYVGFIVTALFLFGVTAIVLIIGWLVRRYMMKKVTRSNMFFRFCNRFLGALTSILNWVMLAVVLGGVGLAAVYYFNPTMLPVVFDNALWVNYGSKYALDLFIVAVCILFVRGGYRIGLARTLQTVIMLALTLGAFVLALYLTFSVGFMRSILTAMANSMARGGLNIILATVISYFVTAAICFVVFFVVIIILGYFFNLLIRKFRSIKVVGTVDGVIMSVVFFGFFIALACVTNLGVNALETGSLVEVIANTGSIGSSVAAALDPLAETMSHVADFLQSSTIGNLFYNLNPLMLLLP